MEYRTLDLVIVSAKGLKKSSFIRRMDVYAVASISGAAGKVQKMRTTVDKNGDSDPTWNFPMKFIVEDDQAAGILQQTLVVKIKKVRMFAGDKSLGEVNVPVKELIDGVKSDGKALKSVGYEVVTPSGKPQGVLTFWYEFGEKFTGKPEEPVMVYYPPPPVPLAAAGVAASEGGCGGS